MEDITSRKDISTLLKQFYSKVIYDDLIGKIFTEIVPLDWDEHIPLITDFWETILLDNPVYKKNAMEPHFRINQLSPLSKEHFDRWLLLFGTTIDELYKGPKAELAKKRATDIARLMLFKMSEENKFSR